MRNELVEELIVEAKVMQARAGGCGRSSQTGKMESKQGRREEEVKPSRETRPEGFTRRNQLAREE
jgi:hypothetical protein